jgi:CRISPR-associated protein Cas2
MFQQNCKGGVLVGYNVAYDWEWIERAFYKVGIFPPLFHYHKLDVLSMAYIKLKDKTEITKFSLTEICNYFNISRNIEHNALEDARATFEVYKKLVVL